MLELTNDEYDECVVAIYDSLLNYPMEVEDFDNEEDDVVREWMPGVLLLCDWGCSSRTVLDCNTEGGAMVYCDLGTTVNFKEEWQTGANGIFEKPGVPFEEWIASWLDDSTKWKYVPGGEPAKVEAPIELPPAADQELGESSRVYLARKKAESNTPEGIYQYARALHDTYGGKIAYPWWLRAAEAGVPQACSYVASSLREGSFEPPDWDRAFAFCPDAADFYLKSRARCAYWRDDFGLRHLKANINAALDWWRRRAELGDAKAAFSLGLAHEFGYGGAELNLTSAIAAYHRAAELNHVEGQVAFGLLAIESATDEAVHWLLLAAESGDPEAQYQLWCHYSQNDRDWKKAFKFLQAAKKERKTAQVTEKSVQAMVDFALLQIDGTHVDRDVSKGIKSMERTYKKHRSSYACRELGRVYRDIAEVQDFEKSFKWFRSGSEGGDAECFYQMALMHETGQGARQDLARTRTLLKIAADKGHEAALKRLQVSTLT